MRTFIIFLKSNGAVKAFILKNHRPAPAPGPCLFLAALVQTSCPLPHCLTPIMSTSSFLYSFRRQGKSEARFVGKIRARLQNCYIARPGRRGGVGQGRLKSIFPILGKSGCSENFRAAGRLVQASRPPSLSLRKDHQESKKDIMCQDSPLGSGHTEDIKEAGKDPIHGSLLFLKPPPHSGPAGWGLDRPASLLQ